jgi:hypothetical protein
VRVACRIKEVVNRFIRFLFMIWALLFSFAGCFCQNFVESRLPKRALTPCISGRADKDARYETDAQLARPLYAL